MEILTITRLLSEDINTNNGLLYLSDIILNEGADLIDVLTGYFKTLPKLLVKHGIDVDNLTMIARGDKGTAFTDGEKVVKVTEDSKEAFASANLIGASIPGVNKIHHVSKFASEIPYQEESDEEPIDTQYYIIIQDLLSTKLSASEEKAANAVGDYLSDFWKKLPWPFDASKLINNVKIHYYKRKKEILGGLEDEMIRYLLDAVSNIYSKFGVKLLDVSAQNVGKNPEGDLILFDFGISESPKIDIPTI